MNKKDKSASVIKAIIVIAALVAFSLLAMAQTPSCVFIPGHCISSTTTAPPCLSVDTLIDTPDGAIPVEQMREGMIIWSVDELGDRVASALVETSKIPAPSTHQVAAITLADGRTITASLDHPTAEGKALGDYQVGDILDGSRVVATERMSYSGGATYDILPDSPTGFYWANGILLASTLK